MWTILVITSLFIFAGTTSDVWAADNLFLNPSLETGGSVPDSWQKNSWGTNTNTFTYPVTGQEGVRAAQVAITSYNNGDAKWYPNEVSVVPGQQYTFSNWSKSTVTSSIDIQYRNTNGSLTYVWLDDIVGTGQWINFQRTFTVPSGAASMTVFHSISSIGVLTVDNYSLVSLNSVPPTLTFTAASTSVAYNTATTLNWSTTNATSCTASGDWTGAKAVSGSQSTGNLTANKTYTLTCTGPGGTTAPQSLTVTVGAAPAPTLTFTAANTNIAYNTATTLNWSTTNATSCTASGDWTGTKAASGNESTGNLITNKTYTLVCTGPGGSTTQQSVSVTVGAALAPTLTFTAANTNIAYNTATTLSWSTTNVTSCTASGDWTGVKASSGSESTGNLTANKTYTLTCTGPGGTTAPKSVTVAVGAQQTNLISNSSLETGTTTPTDWKSNKWGTNTVKFTYPVAGHTGSRAATIAVTKYTSGDAKWMHKEIITSNGKVYQFSAWYKSTAITSFNVQYKMSNGSYQYGWLGDIPSSAGVWKQFSKVLAVPDGAVGIVVFQAIAAKGSLTVDDYQMSEVTARFSEGMVSLNFDDGFKSIYTNGIPILNAANIKSTQYIITGSLGDGDYMTQADVLSMAAQGHEIGTHSRTHPDLTALTATQAHDEIFGSRDDLRAIGLDPKTFCYPFGAYNDSIIQLVKDAGYGSARSVDYGFNVPVSDRYTLMDQHVEKETTIAQVKTWIDQAIAQKQWLIIELHGQDANGDQYSNDPAVLQAIVDYIKQKNVKTVTTSEGIALMQ